jgi:predicted DsbA family dithiol-disulfide isomerase
MEITPANNGLDPAELPKIAEYVGLDKNKFNECLSSGKYAQKIEEHVQDAVATGGQGTPWSIVIGKNGKKYPLSGAQPYESIKQLVQTALEGK